MSNTTLSLKPMLCDNLEGGRRREVGSGRREVRGGRWEEGDDTCMPMADSC